MKPVSLLASTGSTSKWRGILCRILPLFRLGPSLLLLAALPCPRLSALPSGPVEVVTRDGRIYRGEPAGYQDGVLTVRRFIDGGQADWPLPRGQIVGIRFPGAQAERTAQAWLDDERWEEAFPVLRSLWRQRSPYLPLLDQADLLRFARLPGIHLQREEPEQAIHTARALARHLPVGSAERSLVWEALLQAHVRLDLLPEAKQLARDWAVEEGLGGSSALAWRILADIALAEEDLEGTLWLALQPIAFSGPLPVNHLETCYALAIHAFHLLESEDQATRLFREMAHLGLPWPEERGDLAATGAHYRQWLETVRLEETAAKENDLEADLDLRPPEDDLNLPLQHVRKLLHPGVNGPL